MALRHLFATYSGLAVVAGVALLAAAAFIGFDLPAPRSTDPADVEASRAFEPAAASQSSSSPSTVLYLVNTQEQADNVTTVEKEWSRLANAPGSTILPRAVQIVVVDSPQQAAGVNAVLHRIMAAYAAYSSAVAVQVVDLRDR